MSLFGKRKNELKSFLMNEDQDFSSTIYEFRADQKRKNERAEMMDDKSSYSPPSKKDLPPATGSRKPSADNMKFGIEQATKMIQGFPPDAMDSPLAAQLLRHIFTAVNIDIEDILADAEKRESRIDATTEKVQKQIDELMQEIDMLEERTERLDQEKEEISKVKHFLRQALAFADSHERDDSSGRQPDDAENPLEERLDKDDLKQKSA